MSDAPADTVAKTIRDAGHSVQRGGRASTQRPTSQTVDGAAEDERGALRRSPAATWLNGTAETEEESAKTSALVVGLVGCVGEDAAGRTPGACS